MKTIIYCWVPSQIGIYGNEKVDKNAKESLNVEETVFKIPFFLFSFTSLSSFKIPYVNFKPFMTGISPQKRPSSVTDPSWFVRSVI